MSDDCHGATHCLCRACRDLAAPTPEASTPKRGDSVLIGHHIDCAFVRAWFRCDTAECNCAKVRAPEATGAPDYLTEAERNTDGAVSLREKLTAARATVAALTAERGARAQTQEHQERTEKS